MKKNKLSNQKWYNNAVAVLIGVVSYVALTHLSEIADSLRSFSEYFTAVFIGAVIAYLINPLACFFEKNVFHGLKKRTMRWMLSVAVSMLFLVLLLMLLMLMLIPQLIESISLLIGNMDGYIRTLNGLIANWSIMGIDVSTQLNELMASSEDLIQTGTQLLTSSLKNILATSRGIGKNILNVLLALILSVYLLAAKDPIKQGSKRLLKASMSDWWYDHVVTFLKRCNNILVRLDGYVIKPKLFGDSLGVSGFLILTAIIVFGNIFGIIGILLAIPLAAIIDFTYEEYFLPHLEARKARLVAEEEKDQRKTARKVEKKDEKAAEKVSE